MSPRAIGFALVAGGTVAGVLAAARIPVHVPGLLAATGLLAAGLWRLRVSAGPDERGPGADSPAWRAALDDLAESTDRLATTTELDPQTLRADLARLERGPLFDLQWIVPTLAPELGLEVQASLATRFAEGERHLRRCGSALTDGYAETARQCLPRAAGAFAAARKLVAPG